MAKVTIVGPPKKPWLSNDNILYGMEYANLKSGMILQNILGMAWFCRTFYVFLINFNKF